ncbi:MAG: imidazole glycerol phosphate synthase subunit HisF [Chloroflexota bacterium]|nr:imidazole glycerol phosphate synthase subunit HisF [Dehalococcoidia bacterium]MDW8252945.1 imidazole glycerol phosphate synthase subunit HisF [Chloroflexota bacterium]
MLKRRIIPKLLLKNGRTVKGTRFVDLRDTGSPVTNARIYDAQGADELIFLDIEASAANRGLLFDIIAKTAEEVFMPFCVGGGVRTVEDVRALLLAGADKVAINTAAIETPSLIYEAARLFGSQCIVVSVDFRRDGHRARVFTHGGRHDTGLEVLDVCRRAAELGAGEILLTSIDRDGTMSGFDLEITRQVADAVPIPVIASGGAGSSDHLIAAFREGHAAAVAIGSLFHFSDHCPIKVKAQLRLAGIEVRAA